MSNTKIKAGQFSGIVSNGTDGYFLMTNGDGTMSWEEAGTPSPTVTSVTYPGDDTAADPAGGQSVTLTGTNFASGATATIGGTTVSSVSFVSATELTITTPAKAAGDYDIVVTNTDGGTATFVDGISYNGIPAWTTASGSLGTFASDTTISTITLQASEPDAGSITFNITSGALPTGLSLSGANIDGTTSKETAETLYNFTVTAIDDENQSTPRAFSITVEKYILPAPENFEIVTYTGNGGTQAITSKIGKAASFNGSSSYVSIDSLATSITDNQNLSISLWFKANAIGSTECLIELGEYVSGVLRIFWATDGSIDTQVGTSSSSITNINSVNTFSANTWHHVCLSFNGTSASLYVNGAFEISANCSYDISVNRGYIGSSQYQSQSRDYYVDGLIDQVRIFDKALSQQEVTTLSNETYDSSTKSTTDIFNDGSGVALYELDEDANSSNFGQAAVFNGSSSWIRNTSFVRPTDYTISMWLKSDTTSGERVALGLNWTIGSGRFAIALKDGGIKYQNGGSGWLTILSSLSTNTWYNVVATYNSTTDDYKAYLNGSETVTGNSAISSATVGSGLYLGQFGSNAGYWDGSIDQVRIYSSALSSGDVTKLYNESSDVPTANLVAHYKLDGNATDETGSYDGTASNVTYSTGVYGGTPTNVNFLGMAFQPDFVWVKERNSTSSNGLHDSVRGATKFLNSNNTNAEGTNSTGLTSFDSNGFSVGSSGYINESSSRTYVAWCWKAGGAAVSNTDGSITSQVSANPDAGFSIVKYTSTGTNGSTIGHGLSLAPDLVIIKSTSNTSNWIVYNSASGTGKYMYLNTTSGTSSASWFGTSATTFTLNNTYSDANTNGRTYIAYCFHSVDGYQKVGSYTGTGSSGNAITGLGFEPRFLMIKNSTGAYEWVIVDSVRGGSNELNPNSGVAENSTGDPADITFNSDGFTINNPEGATNQNNATILYLAIA